MLRSSLRGLGERRLPGIMSRLYADLQLPFLAPISCSTISTAKPARRGRFRPPGDAPRTAASPYVGAHVVVSDLAGFLA